MDQGKIVRVGTRKSQLARIQTDCVIRELESLYPNITFDVISMSTIGDKILDKSLFKIGEKSLFTKELEIALEREEVDLVVHSLKDLPTALPKGMVIGAVTKRENPRDAVVLHAKYKGLSLEELPSESVIGTSSLRRRAQLQRSFPHLKFQTIRGNLNTRLKKLDDGDVYDGLILAVAGLERLGLSNRISHVLSDEECMYAVGQGALAVECRDNDFNSLQLISPLSHEETLLCCIAERTLMKSLGGGCSVPIAVSSKVVNSKLKLTGGVFSLDGSKCLISDVECDLTNNNTDCSTDSKTYCGITGHVISQKRLSSAEELGTKLANLLLHRGARPILDEAHRQNQQSLD